MPVTESKILADTLKFSNRPKSEKWINLINGITKTCLNGVGPQSFLQWTEKCYLFSKKLFLLGNKFKIISKLVQSQIQKHHVYYFVYDNHTYEWKAEKALPWGHFVYHSKDVHAKSISGKDCGLVLKTWSFLESVENNVWIINKHLPVNITFHEFCTKRPHRHGDECDTDNNFEYVQIAQRWKLCGIHSEWSYFSKKHTLEIKILAKAQSQGLQSVLRVAFSFQAIEGIQTCIPIQKFPNMYFAKTSGHFRAKLQIYLAIKSTKVGIFTFFIQAEKHNLVEKLVFHHKDHGVPKTHTDFETHFYDGPGPLSETLKIKRKYLNETLISDTVHPTTFQSFVSITTDSASDILFVNITFQSSMKQCMNIL